MNNTFSRRDFLKGIGAGLTTLMMSGHSNTVNLFAQETAVAKPNILLIVSDDQGWGDTTCNWKNTGIETPVMDEIAKTGVRFTQFYVNPLCAPTRASFLTGQYSMENGMWRGPSKAEDNDRIVKSNITMLPQFLKNIGYRTGIFGKWHLVGQIENTRGNWDRTAAELKNANLELYNLEKDISESKNLRTKDPKKYLELKNELITFFQNIK